ncbi:universal stress protein [Halocatena halophila]|uniref:universal stress protein n=1 Tax=Halocatena halophila TaxID=2814576 RepID=UPI002ED1BA51
MVDDASAAIEATPEEAGPLPSANYRIAVALDAPRNTEQLLRTALDVAADHDGEVLILSVITKERSSPFSIFADEFIKREFCGDRRAILDRALELGAGSTVPIRGRLLVAPDVSRAIDGAVLEFDCDAVLLGWRDRKRSESVFGRNVDRVVTHAPCDVLVENIGHQADGVDRVLLPVGKGPNTTLAAEVARAIALANDAVIDVCRLIDSDATDHDREQAHERVRAVVETIGASVPVTERVETTDSVTDLLRQQTDEHDVTVLGATDRTWTQRLVVGPTPEQVAQNADSTVIIARRSTRLSSRIRYWLRRLA